MSTACRLGFNPRATLKKTLVWVQVGVQIHPNTAIFHISGKPCPDVPGIYHFVFFLVAFQVARRNIGNLAVVFYLFGGGRARSNRRFRPSIPWRKEWKLRSPCTASLALGQWSPRRGQLGFLQMQPPFWFKKNSSSEGLGILDITPSSVHPSSNSSQGFWRSFFIFQLVQAYCQQPIYNKVTRCDYDVQSRLLAVGFSLGVLMLFEMPSLQAIQTLSLGQEPQNGVLPVAPLVGIHMISLCLVLYCLSKNMLTISSRSL